MTSYEVQPDDLTAHASHLDGVGDRLNTALDAAKIASMDDDAYGLLCAFLPPIINPMEEKGVEAIQAAIEGVQNTAGNVRTAADSYREAEKSNSEPLQKQHADLDGISFQPAGMSIGVAAGSSAEAATPRMAAERPDAPEPAMQGRAMATEPL